MTMLYGIPVMDQPAPPVGVTIHDFSNQLDEFAAQAVEIDGIPELDREVWARVIKAQFKGWRCYIAYVGGMAAAHAAMHMKNGVANLMYAGTREEYRGYGCQTALLRHRLRDAAASSCDLVVSASNPGSISQRNQERAGMRIAYTKAVWTQLDE
jgi:ribosomal protein S18 acetylase RimI-like enzyme